MKKLFAIFLAFSIIAHVSQAEDRSWLQSCKLKLAAGLITAMNTVVEMAARDLTMQGDPVAAEILYNIQQSKPPQQLFCEAGTMQITGMFNHLISSLTVAQPIKTAIENAIYSAIYKAMETYSKSWF